MRHILQAVYALLLLLVLFYKPKEQRQGRNLFDLCWDKKGGREVEILAQDLAHQQGSEVVG